MLLAWGIAPDRFDALPWAQRREMVKFWSQRNTRARAARTAAQMERSTHARARSRAPQRRRR